MNPTAQQRTQGLGLSRFGECMIEFWKGLRAGSTKPAVATFNQSRWAPI